MCNKLLQGHLMSSIIMVIGVIDDSSFDDVAESPQIFILAATSRPDLIDVALLRPGRIEKHIYLGIPTNSSEKIDIMISILRGQKMLRSNKDDLLRALSENGDASVIDPKEYDIVRTIDYIANHEKARYFTAADYKAMLNTAYLHAVHERINKKRSNMIPEISIPHTNPESRQDPKDTELGSVSNHTNDSSMRVVEGRHLIEAMNETMPSLSLSDLKYHEKIYRRFRGEADEVHDLRSQEDFNRLPIDFVKEDQKVTFK